MVAKSQVPKNSHQPEADDYIFLASSKWQRNRRFLPFRELQVWVVRGECGTYRVQGEKT